MHSFFPIGDAGQDSDQRWATSGRREMQGFRLRCEEDQLKREPAVEQYRWSISHKHNVTDSKSKNSSISQ